MNAGSDGPGVERVLLGAAAFVVVVAGMKVAGGIIAPVALALVLVVALSPVRDWLVRRRVPGWLATILLILVLYGVLASFALAVVLSVGRLTALMPRYADEAQDLIAEFERWLTTLGVTSEQAGVAVSRLDPGTVVDVVSTVVGSLLSVVSDLLFILTLLLFMGVEAAGYPRRIARLAGLRPAVATALRQFAHGTRRYLLVSTVFGLVVAVLDGIALQIMGVPLPFLWALLAFVTNYIPNIGFVIGLVPPALLALLEGGLGLMIAVVVVYSVVNFVLQSIVQPKVVGDSVDLSVTVTFLSLVLWAWILGGLGAILAVPLTLLARALLVDASPRTRWAGKLLSAH
jgi:predicted PurR-regulated permease PerM